MPEALAKVATRGEAKVASGALRRCPLARRPRACQPEDCGEAAFGDEMVREGSETQGGTTAVP